MAHRVPAPDEGNTFVSRLWSRFGVRALAVLVLLVGASGGYFLGVDRQTQQHIFAEQASDGQPSAQAEQEEVDYLKERQAAQLVAEANRRAAQIEAARKAAAAAKAEAERARRAEAAASRKRDRAAAEAKARAEAEAKARAEAEARAQEAESEPYSGSIPESCNEYSGNREIGCALMLDAGFDIDQMPCLDKLWTKESGWNHEASNPSSGAYGIPQALPGSKMGTVADDWRTNPATQIKWGLGYIEDRYGTPCDAWAHSQETGWY
jgi:nucleoid-associated protein YgaU